MEAVSIDQLTDASGRIQVGHAGRDIGDSTMIAHCGGKEVEYADLQQIPVPSDTSSYTAIAHTDFVHSMYKHADQLLKPKGFTLDGERYVVDKDGARLFFIHHYRNGDTQMNLAMGCRNSYDKSMKAAVAFGARVFVCDNLAISGDINIFRRHTGNAISYLNEQIILNMYRASDAWDDMRHDRDTFVDYELSEDDGYALMGLAKAHTVKEDPSRRLLSTDKDWNAVRKYWAKPKHDYEGGNRTLWAWYNSFTFDFRSLKPKDQLPKHASLHQFAKGIMGPFNGSSRVRRLMDQLRAADPTAFANDTQHQLNADLNAVLGNDE